jgi:hypothetical protein
VDLVEKNLRECFQTEGSTSDKTTVNESSPEESDTFK